MAPGTGSAEYAGRPIGLGLGVDTVPAPCAPWAAPARTRPHCPRRGGRAGRSTAVCHVPCMGTITSRERSTPWQRTITRTGLVGSTVVCAFVATLAGQQPPRPDGGTTATVLITGSNRGLGLEFVKQYAARGWRVLATARDPEGATELRATGCEEPQRDRRQAGRPGRAGDQGARREVSRHVHRRAPQQRRRARRHEGAGVSVRSTRASSRR